MFEYTKCKKSPEFVDIFRAIYLTMGFADQHGNLIDLNKNSEKLLNYHMTSSLHPSKNGKKNERAHPRARQL